MVTGRRVYSFEPEMCITRWASCYATPAVYYYYGGRKRLCQGLLYNIYMRQLGKIGKQWSAVRKEWLKNNPPNHQGYYECYLCYKWVIASEITLDHILARSKRPDLRFDSNNLRPCCWECNKEKGSKTIEISEDQP